MRRKGFWILLMLFVFLSGICFCNMPAYGKGKTPPAAKTAIPQIKLPAPKSPDLQTYLGVAKDAEFNLTQVHAKLILIDILNAFCPDCQKNAPQMNRIFNIIDNDAELKPDIKIIGIAAGNDPVQIDSFVKEYKIKFPVFPDQDNQIHAMLGGTGPPGIILSDIHGKPLYVHEGALEDIDLLLAKIQEVRKQP